MYLFKKISDTKGTFHEKMGTIKDRNNMDLTEAEDVKERLLSVVLLQHHFQVFFSRKGKETPGSNI